MYFFFVDACVYFGACRTNLLAMCIECILASTTMHCSTSVVVRSTLE